MSVMSVGKKPKALVRPLRAGNSRAGGRPGQFRPGEPRAAASRPENRNVPGVSAPAPADNARLARPRGARKSPARPRLWVVPDTPMPVVSGPAAPESRTSGDARVGRPPAAGGVPVLPRPRTAPDDQIPAHPMAPPAAPRRPAQAPGHPRRAGQASVPSGERGARPVSGPARVPAGRARRTRLTRRGRRLVWASAVLVLVAVITPVLLALASGAQAANRGVPPSAVRAAMRQVVVKPGQSLWSIALAAEPQADPRVVIQQIMEFNALGSQVVVPGESLWVPRG